MNDFQSNLYSDLMTLCNDADQEAFYYVDQSMGDALYRIFLYRMASYTEFQRPGALECRGHTFRIDGDGNPLELASMPMNKFFNHGENPFVIGLDLGTIDHVMDKLDGSLISSVISDSETGATFLKSKGSFYSGQASAATQLLNTDAYEPLRKCIASMALRGMTVNMEYMAPDNRIVIGYMEPTLKILNIRSNDNGDYMLHSDIATLVPEQFIVDTHPIPEDGEAWLKETYASQADIEGYVVKLKCGTWFKVKTEKYCALHHTKDSITIPRRLFEACINGGADDLRSMFATDALAMSQIDAMDEKVRHLYNRIHMGVHGFYNTHKDAYNDTDNPRKYFAIAAEQDAGIQEMGVFGLVMNLYIGRDANIEEFMIKNYKKYGIKDDVVNED